MLNLDLQNSYMSGKDINSKSKQLIVAVDHGLSFGNIDGLQQPFDVISRLALNSSVDGVIASMGIYKQAQRLNIDLSEKIRLLTVDYVAIGNNKIPSLSHRQIILEPEKAALLKPDVFKLFLNIYEDNDLLIQNILDFEKFAVYGREHGIATMAEVMFFNNNAFRDVKTESSELLRGCRLAMELGADILKIPMIHDLGVITEVVEQFKLPTFILGGSKYDNKQSFFNDINRLSSLPINGVMFGRNIWQSDNMEDTIKKVKDILNN